MFKSGESQNQNQAVKSKSLASVQSSDYESAESEGIFFEVTQNDFSDSLVIKSNASDIEQQPDPPKKESGNKIEAGAFGDKDEEFPQMPNRRQQPAPDSGGAVQPGQAVGRLLAHVEPPTNEGGQLPRIVHTNTGESAPSFFWQTPLRTHHIIS